MPTYEYRPLEPCARCGEVLEVFGPVSLSDLKQCPECLRPVERLLSASSVAIGSAPLQQETQFSKKGFTQYRKVEKGLYEKTAGSGPAMIKDDGKPL